MLKKLNYIIVAAAAICFAFGWMRHAGVEKLSISANHRYFVTADQKPFFWLGDTGWLLLSKLNREDAEKYLEIRRQQGFNVIQVMVIHDIKETNAYGDSALTNVDISRPKVTEGSDAANAAQYDYWDHVDWIVDRAAAKGLYMALVPVWGSVVKSKAGVTSEKAKAYASFLVNRYKNRSNIIWMNGGDIAGSDSMQVWKTIGNVLRAEDGNHLITYHPRGRTQSSKWFHNEDWLDFNCFQSGHRTYKQDTSAKDLKYGEDNWRYVQDDYNKQPIKPTLDVEPSYERIPHGLHDIKQPRWTAADVRRYAYWSVFAGGCGYTYGNNDVMQMHKPTDKKSAYGSKNYWYKSINDPGALQMKHIKKLMLSRSYFDRVPDQSLIAGGQGKRYNYLVATRGEKYAFVYTYNGRNMSISTATLPGSKIKVSWFNPRTGTYTATTVRTKTSIMNFDPPGEVANGNDWVLVLDAV
ncbi:glycoside hydrolase family 140 protein [Mucilaginibacter sp. Bleaf8]|nr:glycoside hydrolase family 140 protein [Mucilaginibacter sp. Bleaf8]